MTCATPTTPTPRGRSTRRSTSRRRSSTRLARTRCSPGAAIWDPGASRRGPRLGTATAPTASAASVETKASRIAPADAQRFAPALDPRDGAKAALRAAGFEVPDNLSNFIAVTANQTQDGHPIAVMGPQTSYYVPQLLWEVAMHSSGGTPQDFDGRGIVFANLPYIEIGRGLGYAWSATSGDSDLTDVRVSKMCNLDGSAPSLQDANGDGFPDADGYLFDAGDGQGALCRRFFERTDQWTATPTLASIGSGGGSSAQTVTRKIMRTHYGPVSATATVNGARSPSRSSARRSGRSSTPPCPSRSPPPTSCTTRRASSACSTAARVRSTGSTSTERTSATFTRGSIPSATPLTIPICRCGATVASNGLRTVPSRRDTSRPPAAPCRFPRASRPS